MSDERERVVRELFEQAGWFKGGWREAIQRAFDAGLQAGRAEERASVVAWMSAAGGPSARLLSDLSKHVESGAHLEYRDGRGARALAELCEGRLMTKPSIDELLERYRKSVATLVAQGRMTDKLARSNLRAATRLHKEGNWGALHHFTVAAERRASEDKGPPR